MRDEDSAVYRSCVFLGNFAALALGTHSGEIRIHDTLSGDLIDTIDAHDTPAYQLRVGFPIYFMPLSLPFRFAGHRPSAMLLHGFMSWPHCDKGCLHAHRVKHACPQTILFSSWIQPLPSHSKGNYFFPHTDSVHACNVYPGLLSVLA